VLVQAPGSALTASPFRPFLDLSRVIAIVTDHSGSAYFGVHAPSREQTSGTGRSQCVNQTSEPTAHRLNRATSRVDVRVRPGLANLLLPEVLGQVDDHRAQLLLQRLDLLRGSKGLIVPMCAGRSR